MFDVGKVSGLQGGDPMLMCVQPAYIHTLDPMPMSVHSACINTNIHAQMHTRDPMPMHVKSFSNVYDALHSHGYNIRIYIYVYIHMCIYCFV